MKCNGSAVAAGSMSRGGLKAAIRHAHGQSTGTLSPSECALVLTSMVMVSHLLSTYRQGMYLRCGDQTEKDEAEIGAAVRARRGTRGKVSRLSYLGCAQETKTRYIDRAPAHSAHAAS